MNNLYPPTSNAPKNELMYHNNDSNFYESHIDYAATRSSFLMDKLFDIYDDFFEDDELRSVEEYLSGEVAVFGDEFGEQELLISIKQSPLRIEVNNESRTFQKVLWKAA